MFSDLFIKSINISDQLPAHSYLNDLAVIKSLQAMGRLNFTKRVTFLVGENGIGKSTLIEAIAVSQGFNPEGVLLTLVSLQRIHIRSFTVISVFRKGCLPGRMASF